MAEQAQKRIQALGQHLDGSGSNASTGTGLPPIQRRAGPSNGPRVEGKVIIITGMQ